MAERYIVSPQSVLYQCYHADKPHHKHDGHADSDNRLIRQNNEMCRSGQQHAEQRTDESNKRNSDTRTELATLHRASPYKQPILTSQPNKAYFPFIRIAAM